LKSLSFFLLSLVAFLGTSVAKSAAQDMSDLDDVEKRDGFTKTLAFSKDGRTLRELRKVGPPGGGQFWSVRIISRDTSTGKIRRVFDLEPDTEFFSETSDARIVVIAENRDRPEGQVRLFLFDTETGRTQDIPPNWFGPEDRLPDAYASISGDGRLVSIHSDSGPAGSPRIVNVYNWRTKKLVAQQATGFSAGGFDGGGVTVDGKIEFTNNRTGTEIVDPKTGQWLLLYGPNSVRSPDGAWVVELAGYLHARERLETTVMDGFNGKILGKLDLDLKGTGGELGWSWSGAFCGTSGRFIAWNPYSVLAFSIPSRSQIASIPAETWRDKYLPASPDLPSMSVGCNWNGKRVAIRSGARLTLHDLE
jgi:hypothetical protein